MQSVLLGSSKENIFDFIANPANLPLWTHVFEEANKNSAIMVIPAGELKIGLDTKAIKEGYDRLVHEDAGWQDRQGIFAGWREYRRDNDLLLHFAGASGAH